MSTLVNLVIRDAAPGDHTVTSEVLLDAFADGDVARWVEPNPVLRVQLLRRFLNKLLQNTAEHGIIRLAQSEEGVVGVACWYPYPLPRSTVDVPAGDDPQTPSPDSACRIGVLQKALAERHPRHHRHDHLAYLGVLSTRQNRGIGTALIRDHHSHPDNTATPAYVEATDPRNHRLYQRLGYTDYGPAIVAAGSPPVWPMWYQPGTDRP